MSIDPTGCSLYPPAPSFGRAHCNAAAASAPHNGLPGWRPPSELALLHRPALAAGLLQRVLACVREPVEHLRVDGLPALYVVGIALLVRWPDGQIHGSMWVPAKGGLDFVPVPPQALAVHPCPVDGYWLRAIVNAFGAELLEHLRAEPTRVGEDEIAKALAGYLGALYGWLRRQLRRHADLRAMRAKVARALALDPVTLQLARRIAWEVVHSDNQVSAMSWNTAVVHRSALLQLERELPQALPLYGALLANNELPEHAPREALAVLRRRLLDQGLRPATWRLITRCSARMLLAVRSTYAGPMGQAIINHLRVLQDFRLSDEPPAEIIEAIWGRHGNVERRWPEYLKQLGGHQSVPLGHAVRCYTRQRGSTPPGDLTALQASMHAVVAWIEEARHSMTKNQRRAGWPWMVAQAQRWQALKLAQRAHGKASWPVAEPHQNGVYRLCMIGSFQGLMDEGLAMHHCVFDLRFDCSMGRAIVVSIRRSSNDQRLATAHYERDYGDVDAPATAPRPPVWKLAQVRATVNRNPSASVARAARRAKTWLDAWSSEQHDVAVRAAFAAQEEQLDPNDAEGGATGGGRIDGNTRDIGSLTEGAEPTPRVRPLKWFSCPYGYTLVSDGFVEPKRNADVFGSVCRMDLHSVSDVVALVGCFEPVARLLGQLVGDDADVLRQRLLQGGLKRARLKRLADAIEAIDEGEPEYALKEWLALGGEPALAACRKAVAGWLEAEPNIDDWEWFDGPTASAHGAAMSWFAKLTCDELNELGVRLVDGDHPGSSYNAAELRGSIDEANAAARRLALGCRFR